jgi:hypothetical protein
MEEKYTYLFIDISNTIISHKVAIKAQEKSFYCISPHRYTPNGTVFGGWAGHSKSNPTQDDIKAYLKDGDAWPIAATRELLALWLKQEYHLRPYAEHYFTTKAPCLRFKAKVLDWDKRKILTLPGSFESEELALDAALLEALERIP